MVNKKLVEKKLDVINEYIQELAGIIESDTKEILKNKRNIRALERVFQLIVDEMLDINLHFIREMDLKSPDDFQNTFGILADNNILPDDFAEKIAPVVGLRNKLVHRYEEVKPRFFVEQVKKEYKDFVKYLDIINQYLKKIK